LLYSTISGFNQASGDLSSFYIGHPPEDLEAEVEAIPPVSLTASLNPVPSGVEILASISGDLPLGTITAVISGSGGYSDLLSLYRTSEEDSDNIYFTIFKNEKEIKTQMNKSQIKSIQRSE